MNPAKPKQHRGETKTCTDDYDPNSLPVEAALRRIDNVVIPIDTQERVAVRDTLGRVLAINLTSPFAIPRETQSAMDGYAVCGEDLTSDKDVTLAEVGVSWAGKPLTHSLKPGECARIFTGAMVPSGSDSVVMQEYTRVVGDRVTILSGQRPYQHIRKAGSALSKGEIALTRGCILSSADIGLAASLGEGELNVYRKPTVAFFSTGDELRGVGETLAAGEIYDSNRYTLYGMLKRLGVNVIDMGVIRDNLVETKNALIRAAQSADAIITSAGASVGEADFIKQALDEVGQVDFWKIAMKPGRPLSFGKINDALFFGLPGNPVSVMVTFSQFVRPALLRLMHANKTNALRITLPCTSTIKKLPGRMEFQRGMMEQNEMGQWCVRTTGGQDSHILNSMSRANCFIVLPSEQGGISRGEYVTVEPFDSLF